MFVKSSMDRDVKYSKSTGAILIKANTVTLIDDNLVTAKELKDCYGSRITIMSQENVEQYMGDLANTGNADVDAFLNGETDELPEGTKEIDNEEALRLQKAEEERLAAEAKAKEEAEKLEALKAAEAAKKAEEERLAAEAKAKSNKDNGTETKVPRTFTKKGTSAKSKGKTSSKKK